MAADPQPVEDQPRLIDVLRADAAKLAEHELPTTEELRPLVGALVEALERLAGGQVTDFAAEPAPEQVADPGYVEVNPGAAGGPVPAPEPVIVTPPSPLVGESAPSPAVDPAAPADAPPAPPAPIVPQGD